jgi:uncharacterized protein
MQFQQATDYIIHRLQAELPTQFTYHNLRHTLDVYEAATRLAHTEGVSGEELLLLQTAALYHDCGYLLQVPEHESVSSRIATEQLPRFQYTPEQTACVCNIILATRLPQQPHNLLQQIICDADLDYLGRDDFFSISQQLFLELQDLDAVKSEHEWNSMQVAFLEQHCYFTHTANTTRNAKKEEHLQQLRKVLLQKNV